MSSLYSYFVKELSILLDLASDEKKSFNLQPSRSTILYVLSREIKSNDYILKTHVLEAKMAFFPIFGAVKELHCLFTAL